MRTIIGIGARVMAACLAAAATCSTAASAQTAKLSPATMPQIGAVEERYQSYNVEMVEVTGGEFWKPYGPELGRSRNASSGSDAPADGDRALFKYRRPRDLANSRLRRLAAALRPAYVRVSGTWANKTYFADTGDEPAPPSGFSGTLHRAQWKGVIAFAKAVDAQIITSFAIVGGTRDGAGAWTTDQGRRFLDYTNAAGGRIAAAEFMNEPNLPAIGGAPPGYDAAAYGRDFKIFHAFARRAAPDMLILGPGSIGETKEDPSATDGGGSTVRTRDLLVASQPAGVDAFSYHHYGALSKRCAHVGMQTTAEAALSEEWLARTDGTAAYYRGLRDEFAPGRPLWLTETADAACGGNPWARTFLDTFRYLDQLGRLARQDVKVIAHNTLVGSDYGLLDDETLEPKPNYWGAMLWAKLMGATVLDAGIPVQTGLHVYAHCLRGTSGGVAVLAINNSRTQAASITIPLPAERYMLAAPSLASTRVQLNGRELTLDVDDQLPDLQAEQIPPGAVELAPPSITFLAIAGAGNANCR